MAEQITFDTNSEFELIELQERLADNHEQQQMLDNLLNWRQEHVSLI